MVRPYEHPVSPMWSRLLQTIHGQSRSLDGKTFWLSLYLHADARRAHRDGVRSFHRRIPYGTHTRFVSRRGPPKSFIVITARTRLISSLHQTKIQNGLFTHAVNWKFNQPSASHRGGVWERLIRSIRRILSIVVQETDSISYYGVNVVLNLSTWNCRDKCHW